MAKPKAKPVEASAASEAVERYAGKIRCPAVDKPGAPPCKEILDVAFDEERGVYCADCPKHTEIRVCDGGVLEGLKVKG